MSLDLWLEVDDDLASEELAGVPGEQDVARWADAALTALAATDPALAGELELAVRVVGEAESRQLNHDYRGKDKSTNVLSFPAELPEEVLTELPQRPLGDLVICAPVVAREAAEQGKPLAAHWAHMVVHGVLHLTGHDHIEAADAAVMEPLEIAILAELGWDNPYDDDEDAGAGADSDAARPAGSHE